MLALPADEILTFPFAAGILTFELPLACGPSKLPPVMLPVALMVPATFIPVPVTTNMLALPTALMLTFPFAAGMFTLLLPLETPVELIVAKLKLPAPSVCKY